MKKKKEVSNKYILLLAIKIVSLQILLDRLYSSAFFHTRDLLKLCLFLCINYVCVCMCEVVVRKVIRIPK